MRACVKLLPFCLSFALHMSSMLYILRPILSISLSTPLSVLFSCNLGFACFWLLYPSGYFRTPNVHLVCQFAEDNISVDANNSFNNNNFSYQSVINGWCERDNTTHRYVEKKKQMFGKLNLCNFANYIH